MKPEILIILSHTALVIMFIYAVWVILSTIRARISETEFYVRNLRHEINMLDVESERRHGELAACLTSHKNGVTLNPLDELASARRVLDDIHRHVASDLDGEPDSVTITLRDSEVGMLWKHYDTFMSIPPDLTDPIPKPGQIFGNEEVRDVIQATHGTFIVLRNREDGSTMSIELRDFLKHIRKG